MNAIEHYISRQESEAVVDILDFLHRYMLDVDMHITSSIKWKVPFYSRRKPLAYLNLVRKGSAVEINFFNARRFEPEVAQLLDFRDRVQIAGLIYQDIEEIDIALLDVVTEEALRIDDALKMMR